MPEPHDDPVTAALRPLLDTPSATPRPVAEIAVAAHRRRLRRRTVAVAAVTVVVLGVAALVTTLDDPQSVTTVNQPTPSDPPPSDRSTASSSDDGEPTTSADTGPSSSTTAPATTTATAADRSDTEPSSPPPPPGTHALGPRDPFAGLEAEAADNSPAPSGPSGPAAAVRLGNGDHLLFTEVDFATQLATRVEVVASSGAPTGRTTTLQVRLDHPEAPPIATFQVQGTGDWQRFTTIAVPTAAAIGGRHNLYVTVHTDASGDSVAVDRLRFIL